MLSLVIDGSTRHTFDASQTGEFEVVVPARPSARVLIRAVLERDGARLAGTAEVDLASTREISILVETDE